MIPEVEVMVTRLLGTTSQGRQAVSVSSKGQGNRLSSAK